jgi:hypothetical protein
MAGLVPATHDFLSQEAEDVDARHKAGMTDERLTRHTLRQKLHRGLHAAAAVRNAERCERHLDQAERAEHHRRVASASRQCCWNAASRASAKSKSSGRSARWCGDFGKAASSESVSATNGPE